MVIIIVIYIIGIPVSYIINKKVWTKHYPRWTVSDRRFHLFTAVFSWISIISLASIEFFCEEEEDQTPASW